MNNVLKEILASGQVTDGRSAFPLESHMSESEGALLSEVVQLVKPDTSIEVGFAYGISTLYICEALARNGKAAKHFVIDPFQREKYRGIGLKNVERAGYERFVVLQEEKSEIALPGLLSQRVSVQFALIDGWHTFDHTLVDFFYINKMLATGGIVVIDDADMPGVRRAIDHILTYPAYELFKTNRPFDTDPPLRTAVRRRLAKATGFKIFDRAWDSLSCVALRKVAADERQWNWHVEF